MGLEIGLLPLPLGEICTFTRVEDDDDDREHDDCEECEEDRSVLLDFFAPRLVEGANGTIAYPILRARVFSSASDGVWDNAADVGCDLTTAA